VGAVPAVGDTAGPLRDRPGRYHTHCTAGAVAGDHLDYRNSYQQHLEAVGRLHSLDAAGVAVQCEAEAEANQQVEEEDHQPVEEEDHQLEVVVKASWQVLVVSFPW